MKVVKSRLGSRDVYIEQIDVEVVLGLDIVAKGPITPPEGPPDRPMAKKPPLDDVKDYLKDVTEIMRDAAAYTREALANWGADSRPNKLELELGFAISGGFTMIVHGSANAAIRAKATWDLE